MDLEFVNSLRNLLLRGISEKEVDYAGRKWTLRILNDRQMVWVDKFSALDFSPAIITSKKTALLSLAIVKIDGKTREEIFGDEIPADFVGGPEHRNPEFISAFHLKKILDESPSYIVDDLYAHYQDLLMSTKNNVMSLIKTSEENKDKDFFRKDSGDRPVSGYEDAGNDSASLTSD